MEKTFKNDGEEENRNSLKSKTKISPASTEFLQTKP